MTPTCSKCKRVIPDADVNVATDVAFCRTCQVAHKLSDMVHGIDVDRDVDTTRPPDGAWHRGSGLGTIIGATHRALGSALGLLAVALFWNGIVSVFVFLAVASTLNLFGVSLPGWFPAPKMNGSTMGAGMTIFLWVFLTPFILIGLAMIGGFLSSLGGRTEVLIHQNQAVIFSGIGRVGRRRRFNPAMVQDIRIENRKWRDSDGAGHTKREIVLEMQDGKELKFGSSLREDRMKFVAAAVRKTLLG